MTITVFGTQAAVTMLNRAFNDITPRHLVHLNQVAAAGTTPETVRAFAILYGNSYASFSDAALANRVLANMGLLPNPELQAALTDYFAVNQGARGAVVLQLAQLLSMLESASGDLSRYNAIAVTWNQEVTDANRLSNDPTYEFPSTNGDPSADLASRAAQHIAVGALDAAVISVANAQQSLSALGTLASAKAAAKTKADATDAVDLAGTGSTEAATAATLDDTAFAKATALFLAGLSDATAKSADAKLAADLAVQKAQDFVSAAFTTLTTTADDAAAATIVNQATIQLVAAQSILSELSLVGVHHAWVPDSLSI